MPFYHNKIESTTYRKDFPGATTATVADTAAKIFSKLTEEYATANPRVILEIVTRGANGEKNSVRRSDSDLTALTNDKLLEELESTSYGDAKMTFLCNWSLPDELKKLDQDYVNAMKEHNNSPLTYVVNACLDYVEERYLFTITHTFERVI